MVNTPTPELSKMETVAVVRSLAASGQARRLRLQARVSEQEVADAVGVRAATISRWETGQRSPRSDSALRWARVLTRLAETATTLEAG